MPNMPEWFSTDTAAAYIGLTAATLRRLVERGEVPAFRIGRVRHYRRSDLDAFLESVRVEPVPVRQETPETPVGFVSVGPIVGSAHPE